MTRGPGTTDRGKTPKLLKYTLTILGDFGELVWAPGRPGKPHGWARLENGGKGRFIYLPRALDRRQLPPYIEMKGRERE